MEEWMGAVQDAIEGDQRTVTLGAYNKMKNLIVDGAGRVLHYEGYAAGIDSRWGKGRDDGPVEAAGSWLFGCSLVAPVEAFLDINGFNEAADGLSFEDVLAGVSAWRRKAGDLSTTAGC